LVQSCDGKDYIYSSDKDLQQLVKDGKVIVISPKVGAIPEKFYDEGTVKAKWGVGPEDLACLFAFKGDTSDNIPGTSVPSKVLAPLMMKYKSPEMVYSSLETEKLTDNQRQKLLVAKNQVFLNHSIISLKKELPCVYTYGESSPNKLKEVFDKYEIKALSPETFVELFDKNTEFLHRHSPSLKTISLFE
jgi:DNA polymerase-1